MTIKLFGCPFCGSERAVVWWENRTVSIRCHDCRATGPEKGLGGEDAEREAALAWNQRAVITGVTG